MAEDPRSLAGGGSAEPFVVHDREFKRDAYFKLGVQQVWLVDWRQKQVEVCSGAGKSRRVTDVIRWRPREAATSVVINLADVFEGI